jgi:uncharacterized membrane protein YphA (DoxX/SURF4 family)
MLQPAKPATANLRNGATWFLQVLIALVFLSAGTAKLLGVPMMIQIFEGVGVGQWFRYLTGAVEVSGAVLLLVPGKAAYGAAVLAATMVGAALTHIPLIGGSLLPALVLLGLSGTVVWLRRDQLVTGRRPLGS